MIKLFEAFRKIKDICYIYSIERYTINTDGSIDVNGDVYLDNIKLTYLPLKFNRVHGHFFCYGNQLTSLEGAPVEVGGDFNCQFNKITSFEGAPRRIGGLFVCEHNKISTLEGFPDRVSGGIYLSRNRINEIWKLFEDCSKVELFNYYDIIREVSGKPAIVLERLNGFLEEIGKPTVEKVKGYINI